MKTVTDTNREFWKICENVRVLCSRIRECADHGLWKYPEKNHSENALWQDIAFAKFIQNELQAILNTIEGD